MAKRVVMCSAKKIRALLREYLLNTCQISGLAVCDLEELFDLLGHAIAERAAKKAGTRQFEPLHLIRAVEELFPNHDLILGDFVRAKKKREKFRLLRRKRNDENEEDKGGSSD